MPAVTGHVGTEITAELLDGRGLATAPAEPLLPRALHILRARFASDERGPGARKDSPTSYVRFLADPGRPDLVARHRLDAAAVVESFLKRLDALAGPRAE